MERRAHYEFLILLLVMGILGLASGSMQGSPRWAQALEEENQQHFLALKDGSDADEFATELRKTVPEQLKNSNTEGANWVSWVRDANTNSSSTTNPASTTSDGVIAFLAEVLRLLEAVVKLLNDYLQTLKGSETSTTAPPTATTQATMKTTSPITTTTQPPAQTTVPATSSTQPPVQTTVPAIITTKTQTTEDIDALIDGDTDFDDDDSNGGDDVYDGEEYDISGNPELWKNLEKELAEHQEELEAYENEPESVCNSTVCDKPLVGDMDDGQWDALMGGIPTGTVSYDDRAAKKGSTTKLTYGVTSQGRRLFVVLVRPDGCTKVGQPQSVRTRPAIWVEAGFEGSNKIGVSVASRLIDFMGKHAKNYCEFDFYIVPKVNPDGHNNSNSKWTKTMESFSGTTCKGVDLLSNFAHGNFSAGENNPCSPKYRGPWEMSAIETKYKSLHKAEVKNIALSITLTKLGSVISTPYAYKKQRENSGKDIRTQLEIFRKCTNYTSGTYSERHGRDSGHPMDYDAHNSNVKYSFNVGLDEGNVSGNPNKHSPEQYKEMFNTFMKGFRGLIFYAKQNLGR